MRRNAHAVATLVRNVAMGTTEVAPDADTPTEAPVDTPTPVEDPAPAEGGETSPADPVGEEGRDIQALSDQKLAAMLMMAQMPPPPNDDAFTPRLAIDIIQVTRETLGVALQEIARLRAEPSSPQMIYADLARKFKERHEDGYIARQFLEDGGFWTVFAHHEQAVAFVPTRDDAVVLVHALSGMPIPEEVRETMGEQEAPESPDDPDPEEGEGAEGDDQDDNSEDEDVAEDGNAGEDEADAEGQDAAEEDTGSTNTGV